MRQGTHRILIGDVLDGLRTIPDGCVRCCVTSPPYWGLRDYGVEGQIGLEPTPEAYIERMVGAFREVRRVLADDGTLWLNIGDSYAVTHNGKGSGKASSKFNDVGDAFRESIIGERREKGVPCGLKPKDLVGIPWMLAFALRQPYYTGRIRDERDRIWLAAMIEAEGCLFIHKRKAGQSNGQGYERQNDSYGPGLEVANCHRAIVERCQQITGLGSICSQSPDQNNRRKQTIHRWNLRTTECRDIIREVYPYFVGKQHQARLLCGCPSSGPDAERAHEALKSLHNGCEVDIDFKPPAPMFEPGFYLRSDVIWSKANPMPESVTDRPTKAHEYVFLLSKRERYYYDHEAVQEPAGGWKSSDLHDGKNAACHPNVGKNRPSVKRGDFNGKTNQMPGREAFRAVRETRNVRTVWTIATKPYNEAHFATYPEALPERCIKAGSAEGDTVLDPFAGSGTTLLVACRLGRDAIGCELNPQYAAMAERRIGSGLRPATFRDDGVVGAGDLFVGGQ